MTKLEKNELLFIMLISFGFWLSAPILPKVIEIGRLLLSLSALLLLQSLIRDLYVLINSKNNLLIPSKMMQCMCVESTVGITVISIGIILLGVGFNKPIVVNNWVWNAIVITIMVTGFVIKDYVMEWNPLRIRREKDHRNIIFTWKT